MITEGWIAKGRSRRPPAAPTTTRGAVTTAPRGVTREAGTVGDDVPLSMGRRVRRLVDGVVVDVGRGLRSLLLNTLAGSALTPRMLRYALYRLAGIRTQSPDVLYRCVVEGSPANLSVGAGTFVNTGCFLEAVAPITIGRECALAMHVSIVTSGHDLTPDGRWSQQRSARPVVLGDHVWLGARTLVVGGVTIGDRAVVAAGAVVTKDCDAWGLYAGIPARKLRDLRDPR
jgi:acetyltransferase-like isoleucine patch superfamily enzyme